MKIRYLQRQDLDKLERDISNGDKAAIYTKRNLITRAYEVLSQPHLVPGGVDDNMRDFAICVLNKWER